jgi:hypothetical protein
MLGNRHLEIDIEVKMLKDTGMEKAINSLH